MREVADAMNEALSSLDADRHGLAVEYAKALARQLAFMVEHDGLDIRKARTTLVLFAIESKCESREALAALHDTIRQFQTEAVRANPNLYRSQILKLIETKYGPKHDGPKPWEASA